MRVDLNGATKAVPGGTFGGNRLSTDQKYYLRDTAGSSQSMV